MTPSDLDPDEVSDALERHGELCRRLDDMIARSREIRKDIRALTKRQIESEARAQSFRAEVREELRDLRARVEGSREEERDDDEKEPEKRPRSLRSA